MRGKRMAVGGGEWRRSTTWQRGGKSGALSCETYGVVLGVNDGTTASSGCPCARSGGHRMSSRDRPSESEYPGDESPAATVLASKANEGA